MEQKIILNYAQQYLSGKIEKLENNLNSDNLSAYQRNVFKGNLEKYSLEYDEICKILNNIVE